ncbi:hypothetical protein DJ013_18035 [Arcticibacterium luteifluviistationis]|uniref:Uncharacterized protein n=1 Tax=Arcticibacterium luteifluviistationis TaxID=1784714 RepID=A0A2Z4GF82_9BACT|nr:hypothetical protein DJ013_18035 [Arcticibacterium luteifluviistationis]
MATSFIINIYLGTYYWIKKIDGLTFGAYTIIPIFVVLLSVGLICSMILISCNLNPAIAYVFNGCIVCIY